MKEVCAYPWQQMNVDLTGEVVPCCFWSGYGNSGKPLGNTNVQTLEEIWNGQEWQELRRVNAEGPAPGHPCHHCLAWTWGGGHFPKFSWPVSFVREDGRCFTAPIPEGFLRAVQGASEPVLLHEDGTPLPHPEALHDDIRRLGSGRYSVWGDTLYFSTSDDGDPTTNGRCYELVCGPWRARLASLVVDSASGRNLLQAHEEYERGEQVLAAKPTLLSFISTADCNIDCPACSQNTVRLLRVQHRERTETDVLALVPFLHQFIWHGGEPYLIRHFREFIDRYRREHNPNLTFGFTSNGTLLDEEELDKLGKFPRINGSISVDSFVRETFDVIRAGANFDTVLRNVLRAVARYDAPDFVLSVGMIVTKRNFVELPTNLAFSLEHDIGLNLSPVVVYPVSERIDVFQDFLAQTRGWKEALDAAEEIVRAARAAGARALRRVDPAGMLAALRAILDQAEARHRTVFPLRVVVQDPHGSLPKMREPGLLVVDERGRELAYASFDRGPGEYVVQIPRAELGRVPAVSWSIVHDLLEPMGQIDGDLFCGGRQPGARSAWIGLAHRLGLRGPAETLLGRRMPTELVVELPRFERVARPRNVRLAHAGLPTPEGLHVDHPQDLWQAYRLLVAREADAGVGLIGSLPPEESIRERATRQRARRYRSFVSLGD